METEKGKPPADQRNRPPRNRSGGSLPLRVTSLPSRPSVRHGDLQAAARMIGRLEAPATLKIEQRRELLAQLCKLIGQQVKQARSDAVESSAPRTDSLPTTTEAPEDDRSQTDSPSTATVHLSPRARQTLERLLKGDSEKQVAQALGLSRHTVHVYVKAIYRKYGVCSRGELLAKFVRS